MITAGYGSANPGTTNAVYGSTLNQQMSGLTNFVDGKVGVDLGDGKRAVLRDGSNSYTASGVGVTEK